MAHLKKIKPFLQSFLALFEQIAHLALAEKLLDFASLLLGFNKGIDFMEGPKGSDKFRFSSRTKGKQNTL